MARVSGIKTKLFKNNVDEKTIHEIIGNKDLIDITIRMEKLLNPETFYQILDTSACGTSQKELHAIQKIEGNNLQEKINKISDLDDFHSEWSVVLNTNNTITAGWSLTNKDSFVCECSACVNKDLKVSDLSNGDREMPLSYCICCAGHCRRHLEKLLDLTLKTKEVVSSPINSNGKKPCEFIFTIIESQTR